MKIDFLSVSRGRIRRNSGQSTGTCFLRIPQIPKPPQNVKKMIASYKGEKKVKYQKESLGIRKSMYSALEWVSSEQEVFFVWEDDIVLNPNSEKTISGGS